MSKEAILTILKIISVIFILWCVYNYDKFIERWNKLKERKAKWKFDMGDRYVQEINKLTNYRGGQNDRR